MNSLTLVAGTWGFSTMNSSERANAAIGVKSLIASYGVGWISGTLTCVFEVSTSV